MTFDTILERLGIRKDSLNYLERESVERMKAMYDQQEPASIDTLKTYLKVELEGLQNELLDYSVEGNRAIFIKARMRNYQNILGMLESPDKRKQAVEKMLKRSFTR